MTQPPAAGDGSSRPSEQEGSTPQPAEPAAREPWAAGRPPSAPAQPAQPSAPERSEDLPAEASAAQPDVAGPSAAGPSAAGEPGAASSGAESSNATSGAGEPTAPIALDFSEWLRQVDLYTGPDALLDFNQVDNVHIDLTESNPSGYAQLLAGRRTRLSTILRDRQALAEGMRSAQAIRAKTFELDSAHGLSAGFLAAGLASWITRGTGPRNRRGGAGEKRFIAPVLLVPISVRPFPQGDDFELQLTGAPRLNPALVRQLKAEYGIDLLAEGVQSRATSGSRLTPEPVLERVRTLCQGVLGMHVDPATVVSTFADLSDTTGRLPQTARTGPLADLARLHQAEVGRPHAKREFTRPAQPGDAVDPAEEILVADADERVGELLQHVRDGDSLVVTTPAGTTHEHAVLNTVATLLGEGRSVMVLGERRSSLSAFRSRMRALGLDGLMLDLGEEPEPEALTRELVGGIVAHEQTDAPRLEREHQQLRGLRERLLANTAALHWREQRWDVTPYQAMQTLARLTAQDPAPATRVRFKRAVLDATVDRAETVAQLERAAELRAFSRHTAASPWYGAKLYNAEETKQARALVRHLLQTTRDLEKQLTVALEGIGLRPGTTLSEWKRQLDLLEGVRISLERFRPEIFERPATDLIAATASGAWRRERGIEMSPLQRGRLRRSAKEFIRPQVDIEHLHQALVEVQDQREQWRHWAQDAREITVPQDLEQMRSTLAHLGEEYGGLAIVMEDSPAALDWFQTPIPELITRLEQMAGDRFLLDTLPERDQLLNILRGKGLQELLEDLRDREVPTRQVAQELDLAWWQSAFEVMLSHPEVELLPGSRLAELESAYRRADLSHVASGPARVRAGAAAGWNRAVNLKPVQVRELRGLLKGAPAPLAAYLHRAPRVLAGLKPLWVASPFAVGRTLLEQARVDAVVILDAESTPVGACLAGIARADQVIAFGDRHAGFCQPFIVSPTLSREAPAPEGEVESVMEALGRAYPEIVLQRVEDARDTVLQDYLNEQFYAGQLRSLPYGEELVSSERSLRVDFLHAQRNEDHLGAPVVDSPAAEVRAVVEMVFDHAARHPRQSLAVLTASPRHAARIAEGVRYGIERHPELREFFAPGAEPFRVLDLSRAQGLRRDRVIFSLGVASEAGSRAEHFAQLAQRHGRQRFVLAVTAARFHTRIVTSLSPEQLGQAQLRHGMVDFEALARRWAEAQGARGEENDGAQGASDLAGDGSGSGSSRAGRGHRRNTAGSGFLSVEDPREQELAADWLMADLAQRVRRAGGAVSLGALAGTADTAEQGSGQGAAPSPEAEAFGIGAHGTVRGPAVPELDAVATAEAESLSAGAVASPRARTSGQGTRGIPRQQHLRHPVAVISDGTAAYRELSVRERSRLRPERLERTGWNVVPAWTSDVFADPQSVAARITTCLGLGAEEEDDAAADSAGPAGSAGADGAAGSGERGAE